MKPDHVLFRDVMASGVLHAEGRAALRELENRMNHLRTREQAARPRHYPGCLDYITTAYQQDIEALGAQAFGGARRGEQAGTHGKHASRIPVHDPVAYDELRKRWRNEQRQCASIRAFLQRRLDRDEDANEPIVGDAA